MRGDTITYIPLKKHVVLSIQVIGFDMLGGGGLYGMLLIQRLIIQDDLHSNGGFDQIVSCLTSSFGLQGVKNYRFALFITDVLLSTSVL